MNQRKDHLISIVIPVYKVAEEYVEQCMQSIQRQTYPNWEIIMIDDGNDDSYAQWLDHYCAANIRVIHQCNQGVSVARNLGIEESAGEWVYFCDPDDWMHPQELERLYNVALKESADIVVCRYQTVTGSAKVPEEVLTGDTVCFSVRNEKCQNVLQEIIAPTSGDFLYPDFHSKCFGFVFPWAHLYRKDILSNVRFPLDLHPGEDRLFNLYAAEHANCIAFVDEKLHYYRMGEGVTSIFRNKTLSNSLKTWDLMVSFINERQLQYIFPEHMEKAKMNEIAYLVTRYFFHTENPASYLQTIDALKSYLQDSWCISAISHWNNPYYTKKQKILAFFLKYHIYSALLLLKR